MIRRATQTSRKASEREALRRRVKQMYESFNHEQWERCFALLDPRLRAESKIESLVYAQKLQAFKGVYGRIDPWHIRISVHLDAGGGKKHDNRPFAYVYVVWQDTAHGFHMFRERWVKNDDRWFTRVVGLVPNHQQSVHTEG